MSGESAKSTKAVSVVAANFEHEEGSLLRELVGDREALREVEMGKDSGSELSELESGMVGAMEEDKETGRPNFVRAATGVGRMVEQSTQDFFQRGNGNGHSDDDIFATPGKPIMRGALARSSPQRRAAHSRWERRQ